MAKSAMSEPAVILFATSKRVFSPGKIFGLPSFCKALFTNSVSSLTLLSR